MYLKRTPSKSGRIHLSIVDGYYDKGTKNSKQITVEKIGYLDEMQKKYDDPIAHFTRRVEELKKEKAQKNAPVIIEFSHKETIPEDMQLRKNFGYAVPSKIYHQLGIHHFLTNRQRHTNEEYDANAIMKMLVFHRLLAPASKKKTYENREYLFESCGFSLDDVYRCLTFLNNHKDAMLLRLHERIKETYGRDTSMTYYDVTNFHFEVDGPDGYLRRTDKTGKHEPDGYRKKGIAKNHSPDPIVQMGMFTDSNGIPITYKTFPGNTNDCMTYRPNLSQIKSDFGIGRTVVVADKGMCTGDNIWYTLSAKDGYIFSMSIRNAKKEIVDYVLDEKDYMWIGDDYKKKSRLEPRNIHVSSVKGGKMDKTVHEKQVIFYSEKYDKRAKNERAAAIAKAKDLIAKPGSYNSATSYGAAGYVKNLRFDKETGEVLNTGVALLLDEERIRKEEALDGYYMIITSEHELSDEKIIDTYRELWVIEESFRVLKSDFDARPIHVSTREHIEAHFLTCFVALTIARILEMKMGRKYSIAKMMESLGKAECTYLKQNYYLFDYFDDVLTDIGSLYGIDFTARIRGLGEIKKILAASKKVSNTL